MKNKIIILMLLLVAILSGREVIAKEENFYADDNLTIKSKQEKTSFFAGNNVLLKSKINGIGFVAGNNVKINSKQDYLFAAGNVVNIENSNTKDIFAAGYTVNVNNSIIRDIYIAAGTINITSEIDGDAYLAGDNISINSEITGNVTIASDNIRIDENAIIGGYLKIPENANIKIDNKENIKEIITYKDNNINKEFTIKSLLIEKTISFISIIIIGILLLYLNKKVFKQIAKISNDTSTIIKTSLKGLCLLIVLPITCIILLITVIGIPLSIISLLIYGIMIYTSIIPTAYYLGNNVLKDNIKNEYSLLIISILIIYILELIPIIGGLVTFISLILGLGIYVDLLSKNKAYK